MMPKIIFTTTLFLTSATLATVCIAAPTAQIKNNTMAPLKLATWNVEWLANKPFTHQEKAMCEDEARRIADYTQRPHALCQRGGPYRTAEDINKLKSEAKRLNADIIAFQEVEGVEAIKQLLPEQDYYLGVYPAGGVQKTGFAIKKNILKPGTQPHFTPFAQIGEPLVRDKRGALQTDLTLKNGKPLTLLSIHLKSRCVDEPLDTQNEHCPELQQQMPILENWVNQHQNSPFIVMGDFNRHLPDATLQKNGLSSWVDPNNNLNAAPVIAVTAGLKHPEGCYDTRHPSNYIEHIVMGGGSEKSANPQKTYSQPYRRPDGSIMNSHKQASYEYSDHCPVITMFDANKL